MKINTQIIIIFSLICASSFVVMSPIEKANTTSKEIFVDDTFYITRDGTFQKPYETIQYAINMANEGDIIYVFGGDYNESITVNKRLTIVGSVSDGNSIIDYKKTHKYTIQITADNVNITGFNISDEDDYILPQVEGSLIKIMANNTIIEYNNITICENGYGIIIENSHNNIINKNNITNLIGGVFTLSSNTDEIVFNNISNCESYGIIFEYSNYTNIYNNSMWNNKYGIYTNDCYNLNITNNTIGQSSYRGIGDFNSRRNLINNNTLTQNSIDGLYLNSVNSRVHSNNFDNNSIGIKLDTSNCEIYNNTIEQSFTTGIYAIEGSSNNFIYLNYLINNYQNGRDAGSNSWDNGYEGNWWSDYKNIDFDEDGIGDTPYVKSGVCDNYPIGQFLRPPEKPINPHPKDGEENSGLRINLSCIVSDPEGDVMDVYFYRVHNVTENINEYLGRQKGVRSGGTAYFWINQNFSKTIAWYVVVNDSKLENRSDTWFFVTKERPSDNKAPIAEAGGPYVSELGKSITFNSSGSYDPDGVIHYYRWNFGDNTSEIMAQTPSHTYEANKNTPGIITVALTVIDDYGESSTDYATLTLLDASTQSPFAFAGGPYTGEINSVITFNAIGSSDPDGEIVNYTWDFKDGTIKYGSVVTYIYSVKGSYLVELTVTDDNGLSNSASASVTINAPKDESPGFETLIFIIALFVSIFFIKRKK